MQKAFAIDFCLHGLEVDPNTPGLNVNEAQNADTIGPDSVT
jgi:hypothetical protein